MPVKCLESSGCEGAGHKPNSVPVDTGDDHTSGTTVTRRLERLYPGIKAERTIPLPLFGLAPGGVYRASPVARPAGGLLLHLFTLTRFSRGLAGGFFSVALSRGHPRWTLSSTLPCGVRTFLEFSSEPATVSPAPLYLFLNTALTDLNVNRTDYPVFFPV